MTGNTVPTPTAYQDWTLSKLGNWTAWDNDGTNETRTHNNINALTARSTVANPLAYDANFNLIDDGDKYTYEYDANDKLKIVRDRTTTAVVAEYRYDALGRRVEKEVGANITRYYHAGQQIIEERDGSDAVVATYSYGDYIDEPLTMDRDSERYYYHTNRLYSVYALTDSAGDLIERYSYTPYGVTTTYDDAYANDQPTSRVDNPFTYTGRELDAETLLMHNRARPYNPVTGRFNQTDPIGFAGGDLNLYRYVDNMPSRYLDPTGTVIATQCPIDDFLKKNHVWIPISSVSSNDKYKYKYVSSFQGGPFIRFNQEVLYGMMQSGHEFRILGDTHSEIIGYLSDHIKARKIVVDLASRITGHLFPSRANAVTEVSFHYDNVVDVITKPSSHTINCNAFGQYITAAAIIDTIGGANYKEAYAATPDMSFYIGVRAAAGGSQIPTSTMDFRKGWIPGDMGAVAPSIRTSSNPLTASELLIYLGFNRWRGHTGSQFLSHEIRNANGWMAYVGNWSHNNQVKTPPEFKYPSVGLDEMPFSLVPE